MFPSESERWVGRRRVLLATGGLVVLLGLSAELVHWWADIHQYDALVAFFSLSYEQNLPTWYSSILLFVSGAGLWQVAAKSHSFVRHWRLMAVGLFVASLDESAELHENLGGLVGTSGLLYFDWVIPASIAMLALAVLYLPFLRSLSSQTRRRFILAGAFYLSGALLMELPLGQWTEIHGVDNLGYAIIDWIEETLEIIGASLFYLAVVAKLSSAGENS